MARYEARESTGEGTWWVADTGHLLPDGTPEIAATFWGWVHPDPGGAAKAEADRLNRDR